jgi:two-component system OmpR family sensor kinase
VALAVFVVLALGVIAMTAVAYGAITRSLAGDVDDSLAAEGQAYADWVAGEGPEDDADLPDATRSYLAARGTAGTASTPILLVRFSDGRLVSNSDVRVEDAPESAERLDGPAESAELFSFEYEGEGYRAAVAPIVGQDGETLGVFEAALPTEGVSSVATQVGTALLAAGLIVVVIGALASRAVARASLARLRDAALQARGITGASLDSRIEYDGPDDEVGTLVHATNAMLERLEGSFAEQRRFTADASHELRTPLAVIKGHLSLATDPSTSEADRTSSLLVVREELGRIERLVDDLLVLARLDRAEPSPHQPLDLGLLLRDAAERTKAIAPRTIRCDCACDVWTLGDPDQLLQAFMNVTKNAAQHTAEGSSIVVACAERDGRAVGTVEDDGPGIDPADLPHVFDRFYRSRTRKSSGTGSGLGLAIAQRMVELHAGTITAANRPSGGAAFTISLPLIVEPDGG